MLVIISKLLMVVSFGIALLASKMRKDSDRTSKPKVKDQIFLLTGSSLALALLGFLLS